MEFVDAGPTKSAIAAAELLEAGWTVRYVETVNRLEWRSPEGVSSQCYHCLCLDLPPEQVLQDEIKRQVRRGRNAYEAYCHHTGWKSLVSGQQLPVWEDLKSAIQAAWIASAMAIKNT